jgi:hypothetical protein
MLICLFQFIKRTNHDINGVAYLHVVHILQHPTSRPTTKSTETTMVNDLKRNCSPVPSGNYSNSTNRATQRRHQANERKCGLDGEQVGALGALCSLQCKHKLVGERRKETNCLNNK